MARGNGYHRFRDDVRPDGLYVCMTCRGDGMGALRMVDHVREVHGGGEFEWTFHGEYGGLGYARPPEGVEVAG